MGGDLDRARAPALHYRASGVVAFVSAETQITLIVTGTWAMFLQIGAPKMGW